MINRRVATHNVITSPNVIAVHKDVHSTHPTSALSVLSCSSVLFCSSVCGVTELSLIYILSYVCIAFFIQMLFGKHLSHFLCSCNMSPLYKAGIIQTVSLKYPSLKQLLFPLSFNGSASTAMWNYAVSYVLLSDQNSSFYQIKTVLVACSFVISLRHHFHFHF